MGSYKVTKKHNLDGSITKTTRISKKTWTGKTETEIYTEKIPSKKQMQTKIDQEDNSQKAKKKGIPWWVWAIIVLLILASSGGRK